MTVQQIADRLVELSRRAAFTTAQNELYADNAVSIEQAASPVFPKETHGLVAIREKGEKWDAMVEQTHSIEVSDSVVADNSFACTIKMDLTMKTRGRMAMTELCVYKVHEGKIVSEEFYM